MPTFPDVPNDPGVPPVPRAPGSAADQTRDVQTVTVTAQKQPPIWGLFNNDGVPIAIYDSFGGLAMRVGGRVSDAPVELGAFTSYNKVKEPFSGIVRLICGGDLDKRTQFLAACEDAAASLDLFTIITPERTYNRCNIERSSYERRVDAGVQMLIVDLLATEIRTQTAKFTTVTAAPAGASPVSNGKVQPQPPTPVQSSVLSDILQGLWITQ